MEYNIVTFISYKNKMESKNTSIKEAHCIFKQGITDQEAIIISIYALNIGALNFVEQILPMC